MHVFVFIYLFLAYWCVAHLCTVRCVLRHAEPPTWYVYPGAYPPPCWPGHHDALSHTAEPFPLRGSHTRYGCFHSLCQQAHGGATNTWKGQPCSNPTAPRADTPCRYGCTLLATTDSPHQDSACWTIPCLPTRLVSMATAVVQTSQALWWLWVTVLSSDIACLLQIIIWRTNIPH